MAGKDEAAELLHPGLPPSKIAHQKGTSPAAEQAALTGAALADG